MTPHSVAKLSSLKDRDPTYALVGEVDLVVVRWDDEVSVMYGRCLHRGALIAPRRTGERRTPRPVSVWSGARLDRALRELRG